MPRILLWYRNDLRLHDHAALHQALATQPQTLVPLYCFDPRQFGQTAFGFPKTGAFRAQFLLESLADLRQRWRSLGSDLIVRSGYPEQVIPELVQQLQLSAVYYHAEATADELVVERSLHHVLVPGGIAVRSVWGSTLYHPDDLPVELAQLPELFTPFRKAIESTCSIRPPLPCPSQVPPLPPMHLGDLPTLDALGVSPPPRDERAVMTFQGGETGAIARLRDYIWTQDALKTYKDTRNGMKGAGYSSKFSPWLALGCLSPRTIYKEVQDYETQRIRNESTYWLIFELLWRDYFRWIAVKHGDRLFYRSGLQGIPIPWSQDRERFDRWRLGQTGYPLVDANMRELSASGFMSNRGRQNVASFLTKNLGIDWRMGAEWFESLLIDYDVCSNWGNWNYTAGVGNDGRGFRFFNITKQSKDYDPQGDYVKHWLPELAHVPSSKIHQPWTLLPVEQRRFGVVIDREYPAAMVDLLPSAAENEQIYRTALAQSSPGKRAKRSPRSNPP